jgi:hypothetical protein
LAFAVLLLAGLMTAFFWLGFWAGSIDVVRVERPLEPQQGGKVVKEIPLVQPKNGPLSPVEQLQIKPEDIVRL